MLTFQDIWLHTYKFISEYQISRFLNDAKIMKINSTVIARENLLVYSNKHQKFIPSRPLRMHKQAGI